ncbi:MAG: hypothetical protein AB1513_02550 [Pseudomonadota bacterium]
MRYCYAFLLLTMLAQAAWAQAPVDARRRALEQKRDFVVNMVQQSAGAQRVEASDNQEAKQLLAEARTSLAKGRVALDGGDMKAADDMFGDALRKMSKAARLVPDMAAEEDEKRVRFNKTLQEIEGFQAAYAGSMQRLGAESSAAALGQISEFVTRAKGLAADGKWDEANEVIGSAHGIIINAMSKLMATKTITYEMVFDSPKAEFEYELKRNQSYEELVPMALANFRPPDEVVKRVEEFLGKGQELRTTAKKQAAAGDYQAALESLQTSTGFMQTAVEQAGAMMQQ